MKLREIWNRVTGRKPNKAVEYRVEFNAKLGLWRVTRKLAGELCFYPLEGEEYKSANDAYEALGQLEHALLKDEWVVSNPSCGY